MSGASGGAGAAVPAAEAVRRIAPLEVWAIDTAAARPVLIEEERRHPRLPDEGRPWQPESERTIAHIALRILLERATGCCLGRAPFDVTRSGKPSIASSAVVFSLSHCDGMALAAIGDTGPIGVDVERAGRRLGSLATRRARIEAMATVLAGGRPPSLEGEAAAMQSWVRLEAFAKADGAGIAVLLSRLGVIGKRISDEEAAARAVAMAAGEAAVAVRDLAVRDGFVAALAHPPGQALPRVLRFPEEPGALEALACSVRR